MFEIEVLELIGGLFKIFFSILAFLLTEDRIFAFEITSKLISELISFTYDKLLREVILLYE